jgi:AI-2 transport protein TqsA
MTDRTAADRGFRVLTAAAAAAIVVAALRLAAPLLVPIALAAFIAIASLPMLRWLRARHVPAALAVLLIVVADSLLLGLIGWILMISAAQVRDALPAYAGRLAEFEASVLRLLQGWGIEMDALPYAELVQPERLVDLATAAVRGLTGVVAAAVLVLLYLVFMLGEASALPAKLRAAVGGRADGLASYAPIVVEVQQYLALKTLISLVTGVLVGLAALAIGLDFALFWGLLAFLLNYIPNIGSIIAAIPAVALAFVQLGIGPALALASAYLAVNMLIGNLIDPALMGRRLGLSTLVVLLSLAFWGWVWGAAGMLMAVPLTMAAKIALEASPAFSWIAVLLGPARPAAPPTLPPAPAAPGAASATLSVPASLPPDSR